jgi:hypothetical protein
MPAIGETMSLSDRINAEIRWHLAEARKHRDAQSEHADACHLDEAIWHKYDAIGHETAANRLVTILAEEAPPPDAPV